MPSGDTVSPPTVCLLGPWPPLAQCAIALRTLASSWLCSITSGSAVRCKSASLDQAPHEGALQQGHVWDVEAQGKFFPGHKQATRARVQASTSGGVPRCHWQVPYPPTSHIIRPPSTCEYLRAANLNMNTRTLVFHAVPTCLSLLVSLYSRGHVQQSRQPRSGRGPACVFEIGHTPARSCGTP